MVDSLHELAFAAESKTIFGGGSTWNGYQLPKLLHNVRDDLTLLIAYPGTVASDRGDLPQINARLNRIRLGSHSMPSLARWRRWRFCFYDIEPINCSHCDKPSSKLALKLFGHFPQQRALSQCLRMSRQACCWPCGPPSPSSWPATFSQSESSDGFLKLEAAV